MKVSGIDHRLTTAYHPQANGLDERFNQTLVNVLSKFHQINRDRWDEKLAEVVYSYNSAYQESSKHTPFEAMFGRVARLPVDINTDKQYDPDRMLQQTLASDEPDEEERSAKRRKTEADVKANIEKAIGSTMQAAATRLVTKSSRGTLEERRDVEGSWTSAGRDLL